MYEINPLTVNAWYIKHLAGTVAPSTGKIMKNALNISERR